MKPPLLSHRTSGLLVILLGLIILLGTSSPPSQQSHDLNPHTLPRTGRVISQHKNQGNPQSHLRVITNVSPHPSQATMQIITVPIPESQLAKAPVGSTLQLALTPGTTHQPPRAHLSESESNPAHPQPSTSPKRKILAILLLCLGTLILWLTSQKQKRPAAEPKSKGKEKTKEQAQTNPSKSPPTPALASLSDRMEKQIIKDPILYKGAFEFSYSAEKTKIPLKDGSTIRITQYRPIADLPSVLADRDLLHVLQTAQSDWQLPPSLTTGQLTLAHLLKERQLSEADQFFINGPHLGLLHRDEVDTGQWHAIVRGIWKITPLSLTLAQLTSSHPQHTHQAALHILDHPDLTLTASLAPNLPQIQHTLHSTPHSNHPTHDPRTLTLLASVIRTLSEGHCYCHAYAQAPDCPPSLIKKAKFILTEGKKGDPKIALTCQHCLKKYQLNKRAGSYLWARMQAPQPPSSPEK